MPLNIVPKSDGVFHITTPLTSLVKLYEKLKYALIKEVKKHYDLKEFFKTNINDYKIYASIYRVFEGVSIAKVSEVVQSRYTIVEHLTRKSSKTTETKQEIVENYLEQDEEVRLLAYKLMIDKFNEKYAGLSVKQKNILKEYINNISNKHRFSIRQLFNKYRFNIINTSYQTFASNVQNRWSFFDICPSGILIVIF